MNLPQLSRVALIGAVACRGQVQFWAPKAGGGGVTLVMAFLNGNSVPGLFTPSTLVRAQICLDLIEKVQTCTSMRPEVDRRTEVDASSCGGMTQRI